jgi:uncharacterized membrane protein YhhN
MNVPENSNSNQLLTRTDAMLWRIGQMAAVLFLALLVPFHPYPGSFLLKAMPAGVLAAIVFRNKRSPSGILLGIGLLLSLAGDVALDLDRTRYFITGLCAFLTAHLFYIAAFTHWFGWSWSRFPGVIAVAFYAGVLAVLFQGIPGDKYIPVMLYLGAISLMVMAAICVRPLVPLIVAGTAVFMISDTIIAINKFMHPIPYSTFFNIGLYFVAQFMIVRGFLQYRSLRPD